MNEMTKVAVDNFVSPFKTTNCMNFFFFFFF